MVRVRQFSHLPTLVTSREPPPLRHPRAEQERSSVAETLGSMP